VADVDLAGRCACATTHRVYIISPMPRRQFASAHAHSQRASTAENVALPIGACSSMFDIKTIFELQQRLGKPRN
jgi:hypothetical protein